jgi:hypothetical protein
MRRLAAQKGLTADEVDKQAAVISARIRGTRDGMLEAEARGAGRGPEKGGV